MAPLNQCCWSFCCHDCYTNCSVYFLPASHRQLLNSPKNLDEAWYPLLDPNLGVSKPSYTCILLLHWAKINFTFPYKMYIFFPIMTILFDIFEMFRTSKCNRAFTKYMIEIANYAIMPLKGFLLGIFYQFGRQLLRYCQVDRLKIALGWAFRLQWEDFMINNYFVSGNQPLCVIWFLSAPFTVQYKLQVMKMYAKINTLWFKWGIFEKSELFYFHLARQT